MKWFIGSILLIATMIHAAGPTTTAPTTRPASKYRLLDGVIEFSVSDEWKPSPKNDGKESAVFTGADQKAFMAVIVQKEGLPLGDNLAIALMKSIREERKKSGVKVIKEAKIQKDSRFEVRIYEEYEQEGKKIAELQLFRHRGKRPVSLKVVLMNVPEPDQKQLFKDGEDALVSLKWLKR